MDQEKDDRELVTEQSIFHLTEKRQDEINRKKIEVWEKFIPNRRKKVIKMYSGRFVGALSANKKSLYLSDMVLIKLGDPKYISICKYKHYIGLMAAEGPEDGIKLVDKPNSSPYINIASFLKQFEAKMSEERKEPFELKPGAYEAECDIVDGRFRMVIIDVTVPPSTIPSFKSRPRKKKPVEEEENDI